MSEVAAKPHRISVIVTTKNRAPLLAEALDSVFAVQGPRVHLEVILVDDGSTDETPDVVRRYPVHHIRTEGIGMARARNRGLRAATGDFVTLLDDDDVWLPNNMLPQLELFEKHPEFGAVHAQSQLTDYHKNPYGDPVPQGPLPSGWIFEDLLEYWPQVGTILTRTSVAREVGDLDPALTGDTDWEWLLRVARRYPLGRVEVPVLLFRQREAANEELFWRRFPAMVEIFHRHTGHLPFADWLRLRPILWRHRGWWASQFVGQAQLNHENGERSRALRSLLYAFRCSPPHALLNCIRSWPLRARPEEKTVPALAPPPGAIPVAPSIPRLSIPPLSEKSPIGPRSSRSSMPPPRSSGGR